MTPTEVALLVAAIAALVSAGVGIWQARDARVAARSAKRSQWEANRIQAAMLERLERDAAERDAEGRQTRWDVAVEETLKRCILVVECLGPAPARDVSILVDGQSAEAWGTVREHAGSSDLMEERAQLRFAYVGTHQTPSIREVTVMWNDEDGSRQQTVRAPRVVGGQ